MIERPVSHRNLGSDGKSAMIIMGPVYVSMAAPIFYALTRYAWVLGFPLGMSEEYLRRGQESGTWTSGLFLATFRLVGPSSRSDWCSAGVRYSRAG